MSHSHYSQQSFNTDKDRTINCWSLPDSLRQKLSCGWAKCLEMFANSAFLCHPAYSDDRIMEDMKRNSSSSDFLQCAHSWEEVLQVLGEDDAVEDNGDLKLLPVFSSLPPTLQTRFLFCLHSNISRITYRSIHEFVGKLKSSSQQHPWVDEAVRQLQNILHKDGTIGLQETKYQFTQQSQYLLQDILKRMKRGGKQNPDNISDELHRNLVNAKETMDFEHKTNPSQSSQAMTKDTTVTSPLANSSVVDVNVIVIDDSSEDYHFYSSNQVIDVSRADLYNPVKDVLGQGMKGADCCPSQSPGKVTSQSGRSHEVAQFSKIISSKVCDKNSPDFQSQSRHSKGEPDDTYDEIFIVGKTNNLKDTNNANSTIVSNSVKCAYEDSAVNIRVDENFMEDGAVTWKRKLTETFSKNTESSYSFHDDKESAEKYLKVKKQRSGTPTTTTAMKQELEREEEKSSLSCSLSEMPQDVKTCLGSLREACIHGEKEVVIKADMLHFLQGFDTSKMEAVCGFLDLSNIPERVLVNICDNMPWTYFGYEPTLILLKNCFHKKLIHLQCQVSHTLLTSLKSVAKIRPKVVVDLLVYILHETNAGEYQCQLLTSLCKDSLPQDSLSHVVMQLSAAGLVMNENLVTILQTTLDKRADLDIEALTSFMSLLTTASQELALGAKMGKLLMGIVTKYGKKMPSHLITTTWTLVEVNISSFKKTLQAALKRIS